MSRAHEHFDPLNNADALVREARSGSIDALGELLQRYRPLLLGIASRLLDHHLQSKADHTDLVQQVFLKALMNISNFRGETIGQFVEWIRAS